LANNSTHAEIGSLSKTDNQEELGNALILEELKLDEIENIH
jgi:hypothetical protein